MKKSIALALALACAATAAQAEELFVSIHSSSPMAQGAGLVLAGQALEQKASVRVLLCDAAGDIASGAGHGAQPLRIARGVIPVSHCETLSLSYRSAETPALSNGGNIGVSAAHFKRNRIAKRAIGSA